MNLSCYIEKCIFIIVINNEITDRALDVEFHPSGGAIGAATAGGCIKIYDLRTGELRQHYSAHKGPVNKAKFHPNGNFMLTGSDDSTMKVINK